MERGAPLVIGVAFATACVLLGQAWLFGDGPYLVTVLARAREAGELPVWRHVLYLPLALALAELLDLERSDVACRLVSALSGGVLVGASYALVRRSLPRLLAGAAALLIALSPAVVFFSTTVELHALHGALSALVALALVAAPPRLRAAVTLLGPWILFLAHESSVLLFPGLLLIAARPDLLGAPGERSATGKGGFRAPALRVAVGFSLGYVTAAAIKLGAPGGGLSNLGLVERFGGIAFELDVLWPGALEPFLVPLVLASIGLLRPPRALLLAFLLPHLAFLVLVFHDPNAGGYLLPIAWVLALAAARTLARAPRLLWLAAPLVLAQLVELRQLLGPKHQGPLRERRERRLRAAEEALPRGGTLISADLSLQTIEGLALGLHETNLWREVSSSTARGESSAAFAERVLPHVQHLLRTQPGLAIDLGFRAEPASSPSREHMESLCALAVERFDGADLAVGDQHLLVLTTRP